jgi:uncharacterized protein with GYD domain
MPKYLVEFSYTLEGGKGLMKEGGSARRAATEQLIKSLGGKLEAYYYTFGDSDGFAIVDMPDVVSAAAANLTVAVGGGARTKTTVLITPEEVDAAVKKSATYRPPGQ